MRNPKSLPLIGRVGPPTNLHRGGPMRGCRYGTVVKVGCEALHVKLDRTSKVVKLPPQRAFNLGPQV